MSFVIRPFRRSDREQLTSLVRRHVEAVVPGGAIPVNTVLAQLEREPDEFIVDPWVAERVTLVAAQSNGIVAAALLHRYRTSADVPDGYRGAGEIRWLLFTPLAPSGNPHWHDGNEAAHALLAACIDQLTRWASTIVYADCSVPTPGVYGVPEQWSHVAALYRNAGFTPTRREHVLVADLGAIAAPVRAPEPRMRVRRSIGSNGTRFTANLEHAALGYIEVERLTGTDRRSGPVFADIGNLWIVDSHRRHGIGSWLLRHAAEWLRLGRADLLLAYSSPDDAPMTAFLAHNGFSVITTTERGWTRPAG